MPAGDLVVADYQLELRTTLMGNTTNYLLDRRRGAIQGLGVAPTKTADTSFAHKKGVFAAEDYEGPRVITVAFVLAGTATQAFTWLNDLRTVWAPSTTDLPLYFQLPGFGKKFVNGRPRGLLDDVSEGDVGVVRALATFFCPDPTIN